MGGSCLRLKLHFGSGQGLGLRYALFKARASGQRGGAGVGRVVQVSDLGSAAAILVHPQHRLKTSCTLCSRVLPFSFPPFRVVRVMSSVGVAAPSLRALAEQANVPADVQDALWEHLGINPDTEFKVAAAIPEAILNAALSELIAEKRYTAGTAGRIALLFQSIHNVAYNAVAEVSTDASAPLPSEPAPSNPAKLKMSDY